MEIKIKQAGIHELETLMEWRETVLREVFSIPPEEDLRELLAVNREYYKSALEAGLHTACFAYADGTIVGCGGVCYYQEMPSPDNPMGRCAYLMNIYTAPSMRGMGVGRAVATWLVQEAQRAGSGKIYLESSDQAYSLYKGMGFQDMKGYLKYS